MNTVIEEYVNVDETFQNIKNIKVGSMTLNDLFGDNLKVIEKALEERKELLKWKDCQQDLIKGKDEYIAKLCNDRAELKEEIKRLDSQYKNIHNTKVKVPLCNILNGLSQKERHRVIEDIYYSQAERQDFYDNKIAKLEKENKTQENELKKLKEFARIVSQKQVDIAMLKGLDNEKQYNAKIRINCNFHNYDIYMLTQAEFDLVKKVVEKYGE